MLKQRDEQRLKEYQEMLAHKSRKSSDNHDSSRNVPQNVIAEEKSRISDDTRTHEFYQASSDDEEKSRNVKTPIKSPSKSRDKSPKREEKHERDQKKVVLNSRDIENTNDISDEILRNIGDTSSNKNKPIASQRNKQEKKEDKYELNLKDGQITTVPVGNNKVPELKNDQVTANHATFKKQDAIPPPQPKRNQLAKPGFAMKKK